MVGMIRKNIIASIADGRTGPAKIRAVGELAVPELLGTTTRKELVRMNDELILRHYHSLNVILSNQRTVEILDGIDIGDEKMLLHKYTMAAQVIWGEMQRRGIDKPKQEI